MENSVSMPPATEDTKSKIIFSSALSIIVTALVVGVAVFMWQQTMHKKELESLQQQINALSQAQIQATDVMDEETETEAVREDVGDTTLKEYDDEEAGYLIHYPAWMNIFRGKEYTRFGEGPPAITFRFKDNWSLAQELQFLQRGKDTFKEYDPESIKVDEESFIIGELPAHRISYLGCYEGPCDIEMQEIYIQGKQRVLIVDFLRGDLARAQEFLFFLNFHENAGWK